MPERRGGGEVPHAAWRNRDRHPGSVPGICSQDLFPGSAPGFGALAGPDAHTVVGSAKGQEMLTSPPVGGHGSTSR